jgi:hypothetical protein
MSVFPCPMLVTAHSVISNAPIMMPMSIPVPSPRYAVVNLWRSKPSSLVISQVIVLVSTPGSLPALPVLYLIATSLSIPDVL